MGSRKADSVTTQGAADGTADFWLGSTASENLDAADMIFGCAIAQV